MYRPIKKMIMLYIIGTISLFIYYVYPKEEFNNTKVDILRFDAILELNTKNIGTHVTLFARYWVSPDFYSISINWAEPHIGRMNFATNPIGLSINSQERNFSINNQFIENHNVSFLKPFSERGVFHHSLNNYPFDNIRFAEGDSISTRIYKDDIKNIDKLNNTGRHTIYINNINSERKRNLSKVDISITNNIIKNLVIYDSNEIPLKGIEYQYIDHNGVSLINKQIVLLPESRLLVGFNGKGATITFNGEKRTFKELPGYYHVGGRDCIIDYKLMNIDSNDISVPYNITVHRTDQNLILRTAKLSNFVNLKMSADEVEKESKLYGRYNEIELNIKNLYEKYWLEKKENIENEDLNTISKLRKVIENKNRQSENISEKIKYTNLLMQLDYLENTNMLEDFSRYLKILEENNLNKRMLHSGIQIIGVNARWDRFSDADQLLIELQKYINKIYTPDDIIEFCINQRRERCYWIINCLLDSYLKNNQLGEKRFDIEALRIINLYDFLEKIEGKTKTPTLISQIEWATKTKNTNFLELIKDSITVTSEFYNKIENPNSNQRMLKNKLVEISKKLITK